MKTRYDIVTADEAPAWADCAKALNAAYSAYKKATDAAWAARKAILKFAKTSHRAEDLNI